MAGVRMRDALALTLALGGWETGAASSPQTPGAGRDAVAARAVATRALATPRAGDDQAPAPWLPGDPADSLYRAAREALSQRDYRRAALLFGEIAARHGNSGYAPDAFYWQAFALYRLGGLEDLHAAARALRSQRERYPAAATRGDGAALERRIQGELARRGDREAAAAITEAAEAAVGPTPPTPPSPPRPPKPPKPPKAPRAPMALRGDAADCGEGDDDMKVAALNALLQMDEARAGPILRRVLARRDSGSVCLRRKAVFLVAQHEAQGTEDVLLESARSDPDGEVREQAVFWLSQVGTERAVGALDSILRTSRDPRLRDKAIFALAQHDSPRARAAIRAYAGRSDVPAEVRAQAIFWLGQNASADNAAFLRTLYGRLREPDLKERVLFSLSQAGGKENLRWLLGIVRDTTQPSEQRKRALFWASQGGAPLADVVGLYGSLRDHELREQVIFALAQRDEPAAMDKLIDIARRDPDAQLRKQALFWIGQSDDERAARFLQEVIEQ